MKAIIFDINYDLSLSHPVYAITFVFVEKILAWDDEAIPF